MTVVETRAADAWRSFQESLGSTQPPYHDELATSALRDLDPERFEDAISHLLARLEVGVDPRIPRSLGDVLAGVPRRDVVAGLTSALVRPPDRVLVEVAVALVRLTGDDRHRGAVAAVLSVLDGGDEAARVRAAVAVGAEVRPSDVTKQLDRLVAEPSEAVRRHLVDAVLRRLGVPSDAGEDAAGSAHDLRSGDPDRVAAGRRRLLDWVMSINS